MSQGKPSLMQRILGWLGFGSSQPTTNKTTSNRPSSRTKQGERKKEPVTSAKLFIGNLSYSIDEKQLREMFDAIGEVKKAEIVKHHKTKRSKGFGFVTMESVADAETAAAKLDGKKIDGRPISVSGAKADNRKPSTTKKKSTSKKATNKQSSNIRDSKGQQSNRGPKGKGGRGGKGKGPGGSKKAAESTVVPMAVPEIMSSNLIIKNIDESFSETELTALFEGVATISESKIEDGKVSVEMKSVDAAQEAVRLLDGKDFMGKTLSVTEA